MPSLSGTNSKSHQSVNSISNDPSKAFNQNPSGMRHPNQLQQQQQQQQQHQFQQQQQQQQRTNIATKTSNPQQQQQQRPQQIPVTNKSSLVNSNNRSKI